MPMPPFHLIDKNFHIFQKLFKRIHAQQIYLESVLFQFAEKES